MRSYVVGPQRMGEVAVLADGSATIAVGTWAGKSERKCVGPSRALLADGWTPVPESHEPSFAFHQMP